MALVLLDIMGWGWGWGVGGGVLDSQVKQALLHPGSSSQPCASDSPIVPGEGCQDADSGFLSILHSCKLLTAIT